MFKLFFFDCFFCLFTHFFPSKDFTIISFFVIALQIMIRKILKLFYRWNILDPPSRSLMHAEQLKKMYAHDGECVHCGFVVKMGRNQESPYELLPSKCWCLRCGQRYFMVIDNIRKWEVDQWVQKQKKIDLKEILKNTVDFLEVGKKNL